MVDAPLTFVVDTSSIDLATQKLGSLVQAALNTETAAERAMNAVRKSLKDTANDVEPLVSQINRQFGLYQQNVNRFSTFSIGTPPRSPGGSFVPAAPPGGGGPPPDGPPRGPDFNDAAESGAAMIRELDRMRSRFDPLFRITQQYREELAAINRAHAVGALTTEQATVAADRLKTSTDALVASMRKRGEIPELMSRGIEQRMNIQHPGAFVGDAEASADAFTASLNETRAALVPIARIMQEYEAGLERISRAYRYEEITADEATAAIKRHVEATNELVAAGQRAGNIATGRETFVGREVDKDTAQQIEVDRARAQYDQLFRATQQYEAEINKINQAHREEKITLDLATASITRKTAETNKLVAALQESGQMPRGREGFVGTDKERDEALRASLNRTRASFDPLFAIGQRYKQFVTEIRQANADGAISFDMMTAAIERERLRTGQLVEEERARQDRAGRGQRNVQDLDRQRFMGQNLMFQLQDIAVTSQMGMDPLAIALQQGSQMGANFLMMKDSLGGTASLAKSVGAAFAMMIDPLMLIPIAATFAGTALIQFFTGAGEGAKDLDTVLKEHLETLNNVGKAYGVAATKTDDFYRQSKGAAEAAQFTSRKTLEETLKSRTEEIDEAMEYEIGRSRYNLPNPFRIIKQATGLDPRPELLNIFKEGIATKDFEEMDRRIADLVAREPGLAELAATWRTMTEDVEKMNAQLKITTDFMASMERQRILLKASADAATTDRERIAAARNQAAFEADPQNRNANAAAAAAENAELDMSLRLQREKTQLFRQMAQAREDDIHQQEFEISIAQKSQLEQEVLRYQFEQIQRIKEDARRAGVEEGDEAYAQYQRQIDIVKELIDTLFGLGRAREQIARELAAQQLDADIQAMNARTYAERIAAAGAQAASKFPEEESEEKTFQTNEAMRREREQIAAQEKEAQFNREQARERLISDTQLELEMIGKTGIATQALRKEYELLMELKQLDARNGTNLYNEQKDAIHALTEEYKGLLEAVSSKQLAEDVAHEKRMAQLSDEDRAVAEGLRARGLDDKDLTGPNAAMVRQIEQINRLKETWEELFDTVDAGMDGVVDALFEGTDPLEALKKSARDFARQMFDLAVTNPLKNFLTGANQNTIADLGIFGSGAVSGRTGGFGGLLGNLLGAQDAIKNVGSMDVTAGVVNLSGGIGGTTDLLGSLLGGGAAKGSTEEAESIFAKLVGGGAKEAVAANDNKGVTEIVETTFEGGTSGYDMGSLSNAMIQTRISTSHLAADVQAAGSGFKDNILASSEKFEVDLADRFGDYDPIKSIISREDMPSKFTDEDWDEAYKVLNDSTSEAANDISSSATEVTESFDGVSEGSKTLTDSLSKGAEGIGEVVSSLADGVGSLISKLVSQGGGMIPKMFGGGMFGGLSDAFGGVLPLAGPADSAGGSLFSGMWHVMHTGGVAGESGGEKRPFTADVAKLPRLHTGGLAGDEVPAILRKGEPVLPSVAALRGLASGNDNSAVLGQILSAIQAQKLSAKFVNISDKREMLNEIGSDYGEQVFANTQRRSGTGRRL